MTQTAEVPTPAKETLADVYVVDADVHVHEDPGRAGRVRRAAVGRRAARDREGRRAVPRPARHDAARRVPRPVPRRVEPPPDRDVGRRAAREASTS